MYRERKNKKMTISGTTSLEQIHAAIRQQLHNARKTLIVSHIRPDGDAVGALLGLGLALSQAGQEVRMVLADGVPQNLRFLEGSGQIHRGAGASGVKSFDQVVVVDCSDLQRTGPVLGERKPDKSGGQAVLGRQSAYATPWLTERHGYDPTWQRPDPPRRRRFRGEKFRSGGGGGLL